MPEKIMLLDGNSLINRAFYALPVLSTKDGEYTNAVLGFMNIFFKLYDEERPDYIAAAFDLPAPTFRHKQYAEYKGTRKPMPEELRPQLPLLKNLLRLMNISVVEAEGYEADDLLGTLAINAERDGMDAVVVSGDKDLLQIARERVKIRIPKTRQGRTETENYFAADVMERLGVTPLEFIDVKALMGDASDNIPGVPGIGEKTALKIIQEFGDLDNAIENAALVKPKKAAENLAAYKEQALLSRDLAAIDTSVPVKIEPERDPDMYNEAVFAEFKRLEFRSLLNRFGTVKATDEVSAPSRSLEMTIHANINEAAALLAELNRLESCTYRLSLSGGHVLGAAFSFGDGQAHFIDADGDEPRLMSALKGFFEGKTGKLALDAKRDMHILQPFGVTMNNLAFDAMIAGYLLDASRERYECADIALEFLNESYTSGVGEDNGAGEQLSLGVSAAESSGAASACRQADIIRRARKPMDAALEHNGQTALYYGMELPLITVLFDMESLGVKGDAEFLRQFGDMLRGRVAELTCQIYELAGEEFNINSTKQLGVILFERLGIRHGKKTKTGWSTSADVLEKIQHPIVKIILEYRTYTKLLSTYADGLLKAMDPQTGRIYSTFNQTVTATGRISSTEPNMQNIPVRTDLGRELRRALTPEKGRLFIDADYSQIELRLLAHMSGDPVFIRAFNEGLDIHTITAAQVFGVSEDAVTSEQRGRAKAVNFGIVYGISAFSLSDDIGVSVPEAQRYIDAYFERYPGVHAYLRDITESARRKGFAETMFGRRRHIPELASKNYNTRSFGERVAMNMPIQGSAADIIKIAMVRIYAALRDRGMESRLILQVHDELLVEAPEHEAESVRKLLAEEMENAASLSVPLSVSVGCGKSWYDAKG